MMMTAMTTTPASDPAAHDRDARWQAVLTRDAGAEGAFVYAVKTTVIYCRPSCASRKPARGNVDFYPLPELAERRGFRACKRCRPADAPAADPKIEAVRKACRAIDAGEGAPVSLDALADATGFSPTHLQRVFKAVTGVSPREYAETRRMDRFRQTVREDGPDHANVAGAAYEAGFGSSSRLYERAHAHLGMTPASYGRGGAGARMGYALADCFLGRMLVSATEHGISFLGFGGDDAALIEDLRAEFPAAEIARDDALLGRWLDGVLQVLSGKEPHADLPLDVRATAFQRQVWQALIDIPRGQTRTYSEIAVMLDRPKGQRAVGRACATNPVSLLIPCHRAIREDGGLGGYRWGLPRKEKLLGTEKSTSSSVGKKRAAVAKDPS